MRAVDTWKRSPTWAKWAAGVAVFVAVAGIGSAIEGEDKPGPSGTAASQPAHKKVKATNEVSAGEMVNALEIKDPAAVGRICVAREVVGPRMAFAGFRSGYPGGDPRLPSPAEMFAEVSSRC